MAATHDDMSDIASVVGVIPRANATPAPIHAVVAPPATAGTVPTTATKPTTATALSHTRYVAYGVAPGDSDLLGYRPGSTATAQPTPTTGARISPGTSPCDTSMNKTRQYSSDPVCLVVALW